MSGIGLTFALNCKLVERNQRGRSGSQDRLSGLQALPHLPFGRYLSLAASHHKKVPHHYKRLKEPTARGNLEGGIAAVSGKAVSTQSLAEAGYV